MKATLTPKQEAFCLAIITEGNQSDAYRKAYDARKMKPSSVNVNASKLMANAKIAQRVAELRKLVADAAVMKRQEWLETLTKMARADAGKMFDQFGNPLEIKELGENERAVIAAFEFVEECTGKDGERTAVGYTKKFKMTPKLDVMKELGDAMGFYHDPKRPQPLGSEGNPVKHVHVHFVKPAPKDPVLIGSGNGR